MSADRVQLGLTASSACPGSSTALPYSPAHSLANGAKLRLPGCAPRRGGGGTVDSGSRHCLCCSAQTPTAAAAAEQAAQLPPAPHNVIPPCCSRGPSTPGTQQSWRRLRLATHRCRPLGSLACPQTEGGGRGAERCMGGRKLRRLARTHVLLHAPCPPYLQAQPAGAAYRGCT